MSDSVKKTIAYGKSTNGGQSRCKKTRGDYAAKKARKEGKPIRKQHWRNDKQTLQDYEKYVNNNFNVTWDSTNNRWSGGDMFDRRNAAELSKLLKNKTMSEENIKKLFALKLYNKAKSK